MGIKQMTEQGISDFDEVVFDEIFCVKSETGDKSLEEICEGLMKGKFFSPQLKTFMTREEVETFKKLNPFTKVVVHGSN